MQAQLAAIKAQENAYQAKLDELRRTYMDTFPDVVVVRAKLNELLAQEVALTRGRPRTPDAPALLKRANGGLQTDLPDRWWKNPATAQSLGLTADQQKKMDDVFQQYRLKLIVLNAALEKEKFLSIRWSPRNHWMNRRSRRRSIGSPKLERNSRRPTEECCSVFARCSRRTSGASCRRALSNSFRPCGA